MQKEGRRGVSLRTSSYDLIVLSPKHVLCPDSTSHSLHTQILQDSNKSEVKTTPGFAVCREMWVSPRFPSGSHPLLPTSLSGQLFRPRYSVTFSFPPVASFLKVCFYYQCGGCCPLTSMPCCDTHTSHTHTHSQ